jgi:histidinol-phosphate aminotransferase
MSYFTDYVTCMQGYTPGEQPRSLGRIVKLNTNENPYPPSPKVRDAIIEELRDGGERLRLYSDPSAIELRQAAAECFGFPTEQILHGNGSDELLALLFRGMVAPGQAVAYPYPTYVLYQTLADAQGASVRSVDYGPDFSLPEGLFAEDARLVFVASPNSPSGNSQPTDALRRLAESLRGGVLVIDEAYAEFAESNALSLARELPNVVVLRTFSKSHGLAGMRLGLLFSSAEIVEGLTKVKDSYNLDRLAIVAGAAALRDREWTARNLASIKATRSRMSAALTTLGLAVLPSEANFVLARFPTVDQAQAAHRHLRAAGILVRYFPLRMLDDALRISVGTDEELDLLVTALRALPDGVLPRG